ncbi:DUF4147 domain-containing protein [Halalkalicoccus sp. NIPERK01]|uniref:glycerate kinase type-2 family protein n=1 Tax=Halalkalicoccus sp. NIPERK01 TaxID=3053469 RepID=UPI00256F5837|nr:DUF4147 domain-containing protein [Halalkalicoccus sp. NIPERK01]
MTADRPGEADTANGTIRNREDLIDGPEADLRRAALDVIEDAIAAVHPHRLLDREVERPTEGIFTIGGVEYDIANVERVFVVGAGKGSQALVEAVVDLLEGAADVIESLAVEKAGGAEESDRVRVLEAGHPLPTEASVRAADAVFDVATGAEDGDLIFVCITGGASSLLAAPDDVTLSDLRTTTDLLLRSGAPIEEVNAVRKCLSQVKGGRLAERIAPATGVGLIVVDEVAGEPWGPTVVDEVDPAEAVEVLNGLDLLDAVPRDVRQALAKAKTPEIGPVDVVDNVTLATAVDVCEAAVECARTLGYEPLLLSTTIEGESRAVGRVLAGIAREAATHRRPVAPPCALVSGGETTVSVSEPAGLGGPNQETALGFARGIDGLEGVVGAFIGTDGTDGPTDVAGGIVDGETVARAEAHGRPVQEGLKNHDSTVVLDHVGDAIRTGPTHTNLMDLCVILARRL